MKLFEMAIYRESAPCIDSIQKKKWAILGVREILYLDLYTYGLHFVVCKFYLNRFLK